MSFKNIQNINILILFSGSLGHYFGFKDFIDRVLGEDFQFVVASHQLQNGKKLRQQNFHFYPMKSLPAFLDYEFYVTNKIKNIIKLKADNVFLKARRDQLKVLVEEVSPDIVVVDTYTFTDALILKELYPESTMKLFFYQTRLSTELYKNRYGLSKGSNFIFYKSNEILISQKLKRIKSRILMPGYNKEAQLKKYFSSLSMKNMDINFNRVGMPSLKTIPELLVSNANTSSFHADNQVYFGFNFEVKNLQSNNKELGVIVSFGSGANFFTKYMPKYFNELAVLIGRFNNISFYLPDLFLNSIGCLNNCVFYKFDEYHYYLSRSLLHITFGGINTIKDCLSYGIPLLICPMNFQSDQIHNSLVFEEFGLSLTWNIMKDEQDIIAENIERLLEGKFRHRIEEYVVKDSEQYSVENNRDKFEDLILNEKWEIRNW